MTDRNNYARKEGDTGPEYKPSDAPLPSSDSPDVLSMDLLILSYACGRRARMLRSAGECPADVARQIKENLNPVLDVVDGR